MQELHGVGTNEGKPRTMLSTLKRDHSFLIKLVNANLAAFADWKLVSTHFDRVIHMGKATVMHTGYETQASSRLSL